MVSKMGQEIKREKNRAKRAKIEATTNKYMVSLAWGVFVIILLRFVESGYSSADMVLTMPTVMKTMAAVFAAAGVGLCICTKLNAANRKDLFFGYAVFAFVLALGSLWVGFYSQIRNLCVQMNPSLINVDSRWWISRGLIVAVVIYLVVALIWTTVKIAMIERDRK